ADVRDHLVPAAADAAGEPARRCLAAAASHAEGDADHVRGLRDLLPRRARALLDGLQPVADRSAALHAQEPPDGGDARRPGRWREEAGEEGLLLADDGAGRGGAEAAGRNRA